MSKYLRIYSVIEEDGKLLCGSPKFHNGMIFTRVELSIKLKEDGTIERDSELYGYFDSFLDSTLEGLEVKDA